MGLMEQISENYILLNHQGGGRNQTRLRESFAEDFELEYRFPILQIQLRNEQYGILIIDSINPRYDNKIRVKIRCLFENVTKYEKNQHLIEDPISVDSSYRHLSQLVDFVAYCIRRNFRKAEVDEWERETFEAFFKMMEPNLLKNRCGSEGYGLKIFPNRQ